MEIKKRLFIETKKSAKSDKLYTGLYIDLGYTIQLLSVDRSILMLISNLPATEYMQKTSVEGNVIEVM